MTKAYTATAAREGRWWVITVAGIGVTQARTLRDAAPAARGLVSAMLDVDEDVVAVDVIPELPPKVRADLDEARRKVAQLEVQQREAARASRDAVAVLTASGLSGADVATVLGVSPQRVSQLLRRKIELQTDVITPSGQSGASSRVSGRRATLGAKRRGIRHSAQRKVGGMAPNRNVVPNPSGGWDVTGGGTRASAHTETQAAAIERAKGIVSNAGGGEVSIYGRDGKVRAKDTVDPGNDSRNIPG